MAKTKPAAPEAAPEDVATDTQAAETESLTESPAIVLAPQVNDDEETIREKMRAGLSREQALQVLRMQRENDARLG